MSFWLPGQFGSLAAVPTAPGWSLGAVYYHPSASEGGSKTFQRGGRITGGVDARADLIFVAPTYTFKEPLLGGQASASVVGAFGRSRVGVNTTLSGPGGGVISGAQSDSRTGVSDLYPLGTLKWNHGVHNFMAYTMMGIPVGAYDANRLANIGLGHWSVDAGGGYTYFDKKNEFSAVLGFTYNFENPDTDYKNGVDSHLDWAASHFFSEHVHAGVVGYFYNQLGGDSGTGARLGDFKSRVAGVGPQVGYFFKVGSQEWYVTQGVLGIRGQEPAGGVESLAKRRHSPWPFEEVRRAQPALPRAARHSPMGWRSARAIGLCGRTQWPLHGAALFAALGGAGKFFSAFAAGNLEGIVACFDDDFVWTLPAGSPPLPKSAWQIVSEAHMQPGDMLIEKRQYGAFYGTGLDQQLRRRNIRTIVLGGIATNIGVESTARAALDRGYALVFAEDGMTGLTEASHRFACDTIFQILGRVRSSDEIGRAIEAGARA
ncbi:isochorismatase family protein [Cupriavidus sp. DF5525]|uniref:isochorismatase family protein n=1 Tax=Cupriavidus sp. DF5525 TaxID=3160989 RepID=UPI00040850E6